MAIHAESQVRLGIQIPSSMHKHLKIICAEDGISMHRFVLNAIENAFATREEQLDEIAYDRGMKDIEEHEAVSMEEMDRAMGI